MYGCPLSSPLSVTATTIEAFYSKLTGRPASWGNTGAIGRGSSSELLVVALALALAASLAWSMVRFASRAPDALGLSGVLPLWAFGLLSLDAYARMACVSVQEFFGFSYTSLKAQLVLYELAPALTVLVATLFYASAMKQMP
jgi:hypothetical protein